MGKKIIGGLIVVIGAALLFVFGSALILFLAPGVEIFGIRYVSAGASECNIKEPISSFSGDIYIDTHGVPVTLNITDYYNSSVEFSQNFIGFTRSNYDKAGLDISVDSEGDLHIKTKEIVKWVYAHENGDNFKLVITLPVTLFTDSENLKSFYLKGNSSSLTINGNAVFTNFSMESTEGLTINNSLETVDFKYHTSKLITIDDKIGATNLDLKSTGSSINITKPISGDVTASTKSGDVKFVSCDNLTVSTSSGNIRTYGEGLTLVNGSINIETKSGDVQLGSVSVSDSDAKCIINSISGDVSISNMVDGDITTDRGKVNIGIARAIVINANVGNVAVNSVGNAINVNGRNGKVTLGQGGTISNPTVYTTTGAIEVINAYGEVNLESTSNSIKYVNIGGNKISLKAGRELTATGLKGEVYAKANGDISLKFIQISGNVTIESGSKCDKIDVEANSTSYINVDYKLTSTKGEKAKVYVGEDLIDENTTLDSGSHEGNYLVFIKTSYAKITLKLGV